MKILFHARHSFPFRSLRRLLSPANSSLICVSGQEKQRVSFASLGSESESERWRRLATDMSAGFTSTFEDEDGNIVYPKRKPTNAIALRSRKSSSTIERSSSFVDWRKVRFRAGDGGDGCISFLHLINCMNAGPDGGDGGNGAHIVLRADSQVKSLANMQASYTGDRGRHGEGKDIIGSSGEHQYVDVPVGTLVKNCHSDEVIADLDLNGSMFIAARGGQGGKGNHFFLSDKNRHPQVAEIGAKGEDNVYVLEMKVVADCGFVGFPNVGKSTLLRAISRARPRVACYPFTTMNPYIGVIQYDDFFQLSVADLPGIVVDAHKNRGLGIDFLKHVERCVCLMFVLDLSQAEPWEQLTALKQEMECFKPGLSKQPHAVVGNKLDSEFAEQNLHALRAHIEQMTPAGALPLPVIPVSGKFGQNVKELVDHIRALYDMYSNEKEEEE